MDFLSLLKVDVKEYVKTRRVDNETGAEADFIPWGRAIQLAGRPKHDAVMFNDALGMHGCRHFFGGCLVAIDMDIGNGDIQRVWRPIYGLTGKTVPAGKETSTDINKASKRCLARACAMVHGIGLSVSDGKDEHGKFLHCRWAGDGGGYAESLGVAPDTELAHVKPLLDLKINRDKKTKRVISVRPYLSWAPAIAACRITDPTFLWEVLEMDFVDKTTGEVQKVPALKVSAGWMVGVRIRYKGTFHTEWLPIMDVAQVQTQKGPKNMEFQPVLAPNLAQWHNTVMRCLTKGIAVLTGYGLADYSEMEVGEGDPGLIEARNNLIEQIVQAVEETNSDLNALMRWAKVSSLDDAPLGRLQAMLNGVESKKRSLNNQKQVVQPASNETPEQPALEQEAA